MATPKDIIRRLQSIRDELDDMIQKADESGDEDGMVELSDIDGLIDEAQDKLDKL